MIKVNPVKTVKTVQPKKTVNNLVKKVEKTLIDTSTEEFGYFLVDGKAVPIIFPR